LLLRAERARLNTRVQVQ